MSKQEFVERYKAARAAFESSLAGLDEAEAGAITGQNGEWPSIKDIIGHIAAWEREVLVADEMIKRDEESYLNSLNQATFSQTQAEHRRSWSLAQVRTELDLNYEALLMAWDEYENDDGPFGPASWEPDQTGSLWPVIERQIQYGREIARRRGLKLTFPG